MTFSSLSSLKRKEAHAGSKPAPSPGLHPNANACSTVWVSAVMVRRLELEACRAMRHPARAMPAFASKRLKPRGLLDALRDRSRGSEADARDGQMVARGLVHRQ